MREEVDEVDQREGAAALLGEGDVDHRRDRHDQEQREKGRDAERQRDLPRRRRELARALARGESWRTPSSRERGTQRACDARYAHVSAVAMVRFAGRREMRGLTSPASALPRPWPAPARSAPWRTPPIAARVRPAARPSACAPVKAPVISLAEAAWLRRPAWRRSGRAPASTSARACALSFLASAASASWIALVAAFSASSWKVISWSNSTSTDVVARLRHVDVELHHRARARVLERVRIVRRAPWRRRRD